MSILARASAAYRLSGYSRTRTLNVSIAFRVISWSCSTGFIWS